MSLKVYKVSDCDWYAAENAERAAALWLEDTGDPCEDGYPELVSDEEMDREVPDYDEDEQPTGEMTSLRAILASMPGEGPICSTEY